MTPTTAFREALELVEGPDGQRLRCVAEPVGAAPRGQVLLLPPFAEELNKSRRMCARLARLLAQRGWRVVRIDLAGCGDSAGELRDVDWTTWIDELRSEAQRMNEALPGPFWLWGVRAGALFAAPLLAQLPAANLLLWQPVLSGSTYLQQFLRLSLAAGLFGGAKAQTDARPASQRLADGETVEVAGYEITPALAEGLKGAAMKLPAPGGGRVSWFEISAAAADGCSPAATRAAEALVAAGWPVEQQAIAGDPFWQSTEIVENEALLQASADAMELVHAA